jgi:CheY-like chemotaxis protein
MNPITKIKILSIEDSETFRLLIRMALEFEGFDVLEAVDGHSGLRMARAHLPSLILLDLRLPDLDGLQVCHRLMDDSRLRQIPIVVISASDDSEEIEASLKLGAKAYLTKPFRPQYLIDIVRKQMAAGFALA